MIEYHYSRIYGSGIGYTSITAGNTLVNFLSLEIKDGRKL